MHASGHRRTAPRRCGDPGSVTGSWLAGHLGLPQARQPDVPSQPPPRPWGPAKLFDIASWRKVKRGSGWELTNWQIMGELAPTGHKTILRSSSQIRILHRHRR